MKNMALFFVLKKQVRWRRGNHISSMSLCWLPSSLTYTTKVMAKETVVNVALRMKGIDIGDNKETHDESREDNRVGENSDSAATKICLRYVKGWGQMEPMTVRGNDRSRQFFLVDMPARYFRWNWSCDLMPPPLIVIQRVFSLALSYIISGLRYVIFVVSNSKLLSHIEPLFIVL